MFYSRYSILKHVIVLDLPVREIAKGPHCAEAAKKALPCATTEKDVIFSQIQTKYTQEALGNHDQSPSVSDTGPIRALSLYTPQHPRC